jgi:hypothetical protein
MPEIAVRLQNEEYVRNKIRRFAWLRIMVEAHLLLLFSFTTKK